MRVVVQASINGRAGETFAFKYSIVWRFSYGTVHCVDHSTTTEAAVFSQPFGQTLFDSKQETLKRCEWRIDNAIRRFTHLTRRWVGQLQRE